MIVRNDIPVFIDDESGSQASLFVLPLLFISEKFIEKILEWILISLGALIIVAEHRSAALDGFYGADIDHRRTNGFGQHAEAFRDG